MVNLKSRYQKELSIVSREIKDDTVLVPLCQNAADLESIYTLNPVAGRIWKCIDGENTLKNILDIILSEFRVTAQKAKSDLLKFIAKLEKIGAISKTK